MKDGDQVVLGINPRADKLAKEIGAKTFNNKAYGTELLREMGMGERPIWTVGVERTVSNPNVRLTVLDGRRRRRLQRRRRAWTSIEWHLGGKRVFPERFKPANGKPVP
ncbi:polymorphic toxin type 27 domain-containing protein [Streptomyces sp. SID12488]|uniref:polymorphic toxin type 27 domain-containing protein n=1 Tax=Streptomyces sp. SID12488 TaxID=2706040 RepID=UPI0013DBC314|nr:hypothetical protein [Streptomyces sp. SID12488]